MAIRQRAALEPLFYAGGTESHVDAVFYGALPPPLWSDQGSGQSLGFAKALSSTFNTLW